MIFSMTGFGRAARESGGVAFEVEARSVNHRHLDLRIRLPRLLADRENALKQRVQSKLARGKVEIVVNLASNAATAKLVIDEAIAGQYVEAARALSSRHALAGGLDVAALLALPGVTRVVEAEIDTEALAASVEEALDEAVRGMLEMRAAEGEALRVELEGRLATVLRLSEAFQARSGEVVQAARQRLQKRAEQIRRDVGLSDDARLHQEIVIAADRLDITEELVRLRSHIAQFEDTMRAAGLDNPVGRRLDFLLQELGREANTVGSKASDAALAQDVVALKTELERIREQVQNIE
ncbi:MAG: YicC family protein [Deltaproteobacteria bacterium]|nr:YicC family protein [Deltaproteobacteria bacterium]